jgi:2-aminoadipate transaminase
MTTPLTIVQTQIPPGMIDLGLGNPPLSLLPLEMIRVAAQEQLSQSDTSFLQYGTEQGDGYFRVALAGFLSRGYDFSVDPERLFITTGISNGLDLLCSLFTKTGDTIFVEEPSYFLALKIFADHQLQVMSVETDQDGIIIEALEEKLAQYKPRFLYTIPTYQNPSGHTLTQERRARIVELSQEFDFLVLADEVYQLLSYEGNPPKSFGVYTDAENVISLGSFSKILAPGLRMGWIQAHPNRISRMVGSGLLDSGGGLNPFTSALMRGVIESGNLEKNINSLIDVYRSRVQVMDASLREHLPEAKYSLPQGGYFFWLRMPDDIDGTELRKKAQAFKVDLRQGALFSSRNELKNYIRLCFVFHEADEIKEGIRRIRECLESSYYRLSQK